MVEWYQRRDEAYLPDVRTGALSFCQEKIGKGGRYLSRKPLSVQAQQDRLRRKRRRPERC